MTGLSDTPNVSELEKKFVYGGDSHSGGTESPNDQEKPSTIEPRATTKSEEVLPQFRGRVPLTTRCHPELASALKRASLKRQLEGLKKYRIQEIVEEAVEK
ncbi:hypothetical protein C5Y93_13590 [Blastopirellula marina]|uniref:Uncharacterized protein n=1 Tax=Blastopirellula marina TaxID=124 RepID=A0A2S8GM18_9BACT|nr:hypothetical protein C5Y93_13590 [Blastopirellula marina]